MKMKRIYSSGHRILAIALTVLLLFTMFQVLGFAIEVETNYFAVTSDVHGNTGNVSTWLSKNGIQLEYMVFCGDYNDNWSPTVINTIKTNISTYNDSIIPIFTMGNHCWGSESEFETATGYSRTGVQNNPATDGYTIYTLGASAGSYSPFAFTDGDIANLKSALESADAGEPFFIASHYPLHYGEGRKGTNAKKLITLLNDYSNVFFFWGHNHHSDSQMGSIKTKGDTINPADDSSIAQEIQFTYCNAGHMGKYTGGTGVRIEVAKSTESTAVGLSFIDMNGNTTTTKSVTLAATDPSGKIASVAITGITAPVVGATPDIDALTSGSRYTPSVVTWNPSVDGTFSCDTAYTAEVTLTPVNGYEFAEDVTATLNGNPVASAMLNTDGTLTVTYAFLPTDSNIGASSWNGTIATAFGGGQGTSGDPYLIVDGAQLAYLAQQVNAGNEYSGSYFKQTADIDLNSIEWTPIGIYVSSQGTKRSFSGTFDGDGYIISNLKVAQSFAGDSSNNKSLGLFGYLKGTVKDAGLTDLSVSVTNTNTGSSSANAYAGGIAGYVDGGSIFNSYVEGTISAGTNSNGSRCCAGGLVGYFNSGDVMNSYSAVAASISGSYSSTSGNGGLVGYNSGGTFKTSYWDSSLSANGTVGGTATGTITKTTNEMKDSAFVNLLNENKDSYKTWMSDSGTDLNEGYPIHERAIEEKILLDIAVTSAPTKVSYYAGQVFNPDGMVVTAMYDDGTTVVLAPSKYSYAPSEALKITDTTVTISYKEKTATQAITVSANPTPYWDGSIATAFGGGQGTSGDPYLIADGAQLAYLAQQVNAGNDYSGSYFKQTADIDLNSIEWTPIGIYASSQGTKRSFSGTFDGDGYIISNLKVAQSFAGDSSNNKSLGLFGYLKGTVKDAGLTDLSVSVTNTNTGSSSANAYAGGIAGYVDGGSIFNSYVEGTILAGTNSNSSRCCAGGLVGYFNKGDVMNSYSAVAASISGSYSSTSGNGGLAGYNSGGTFETSYWDSSLSANGTVGGTATGTIAKTTNEMKDSAFVNLLNEGNGSYKTWMSDSGTDLNEGYPIHERAAAEKILTGIAVTTPPTKVTYYAGQLFDPAGMVVTATYNDGTTVDLTSSEYSYAPSGALKITDTTVTINYKEKTATQAITVSAKAITGIKVTTPPAKVLYIAGQVFDPTGMVVTATYNDGTTVVIEEYEYAPKDALAVTDTAITISYEGMTATQAITVSAKAITGISVTKLPDKVSYIAGQSFDPAGMVVTATYDDGTTVDLTSSEYSYAPSGALKITDTAITISYGVKTATQAITVSASSGGGGGAGGGGGGGGVIHYTLTFNTDGGSAINSLSKSSGTKVDLSVYAPTKDGFVFDGWYANIALTEKITSVELKKDTTVFAKWTEKADSGKFPFTDVKDGDWFHDDVKYVYEKRLMMGTSDATFSPDATTSRGMIVTILYRLEGEPAVSGICPFDDVTAGMYYEKAIIWAATNGIVSGYSNNKFGPNDNITREQMAAILYRYANYKGYDVSVGEDTNILSFDDAFSISEYAIPAFQWACGSGIIYGSASTLSPQGNATRVQAAAILHRFCELNEQ